MNWSLCVDLFLLSVVDRLLNVIVVLLVMMFWLVVNTAVLGKVLIFVLVVVVLCDWQWCYSVHFYWSRKVVVNWA